MRRKRWIFLILAVIVIAGGAGAWLTLRGRGPEGIEVQAEPAERMRIVQTVSATGRIQPKTQVNISADVSAKITRLGIEEGDRVERGELLVELERERYLAEVESAEANLRVSESNSDVTRENLVKAEKDLARIRELFDQELETEERLDAAQAAYLAEKARYRSSLDRAEQAKASLKQSRDALSKTSIYAPMSGTISLLNKEVGEIALGSQFQEDVIMVVSNLSGMEALVDVDENDIVSISFGDRATIEVDALPEVEFEGTVTEIANSAKVSGQGTTDQKTEFEVKIAIVDPGTRLRPGMTASADVVTETRDDVLGVPIQAVAVRTLEQLGVDEDEPGDWEADDDGFVEIVFVVQDGAAVARAVQTGIQSDTDIEIAAGLQNGELVVVGNYRAISKDLEDGAAVLITEEDEAAGDGERPGR